MTDKIEILAPCGTVDSFYAAVNAGCDACYLAGDMFGARAYAGNFSPDTLINTIEHAHLNSVQVYMTVNTLLKNNEIGNLVNFIMPYYKNGLDAVIVQDLGVFSVIRKYFPDLKIHCSTQMNISSIYGANMAKKLGATRVVTAREMSLNEIKKIKENVDIEIETFVHGAMCFCYSGRCYLSSFAGGRSGNRGRCAQPCRKMYDGSYQMSMKDMCSLKMVPSIIEAGIDSLKIEGRMKNEYYVASCVDAYKTMANDYYLGCFSEAKAEKYQSRLAEVFNRGGFTNGYFFTRNGSEMIDKTMPGRKGVKVGEISSIANGKILFKAEKEIKKGDILNISIKNNEPIVLTSNADFEKGKTVTLNAPRTKQINKGLSIYRTKSEELLQNLEESLINKTKKILLDGEIYIENGKKISLTLSTEIFEKKYSVTSIGDLVLSADKRPVTDEVISEKLNKLGNTIFSMNNLTIINDNASFIPSSALNNLRRNALTKLSEEIKESFSRLETTLINSCDTDNITFKKYNTETTKEISVLVNTFEQAKVVLSEDMGKKININKLYLEYSAFLDKDIQEISHSAHDNSVNVILCMPHILRNDNLFNEESLINAINNSDGIFVRNICELSFVLENDLCKGKELICGNSLYAYNDEAISFYVNLINKKKTDIKNIVFDMPAELNKSELFGLNYPIDCICETKIYGKEELMVTAQCLNSNSKNHCCKKDQLNYFTIVDELKNPFISVSYCKMCYNVIYNGVPTTIVSELSNMGRVRLAFVDENTERVKEVINNFCDLFAGKSVTPDYKYTTGHFNRGIE